MVMAAILCTNLVMPPIDLTKVRMAVFDQLITSKNNGNQRRQCDKQYGKLGWMVSQTSYVSKAPVACREHAISSILSPLCVN